MLDRGRSGLSPLAAAITLVATIWLVLILTTPLGAVRGRAPLLTVAAYHIGSLICHQRPERSFHLSGLQMPVCARCFGLYLAGAAGLWFAWISRLRIPGRVTKVMMAVAAAPMAITVALEMIGLISTTNLIRMSTGLPLGFAAGALIVTALTPVNSDMIGS